MQRHGSFRSKTRQKLSKNYREKGKISISKFFQELEPGDNVVLKADPSFHKGMYFPRFHGKRAIVTGKKGECYIVKINDHDKEKTLIVHPLHLKKVK
ncbi:50S ribosomal protein L21e [Candidatus Woesearchaeota archaeon]|nr:50S ribosomal protein L21e [Candidatus Woesearchaeota archaeon]